MSRLKKFPIRNLWNAAWILLWLILIVVGITINLSRQPQSTWVAARDLPANHQVQRGDLLLPMKIAWLGITDRDGGQNGLYLLKAKRKGDPVRPAELAQSPDLSAAMQPTALVTLPVSDQIAPLLNLIDAGSQVMICRMASEPSKNPAETCFGDPLVVAAVHQSTPDVPARWLVLAVPQDQLAAYTQISQPEQLLVFLVAGRQKP